MNEDREAELYAYDISAATWHKATASGGEGNCVEVAHLPDGCRAVRDSKDPARTPLRFTASGWAAFRAGVIDGEL
ncbi:DUF397 domain-containing protein [Streptomyces sp. NBC_01221]|uniref:DUF397 domain-containing protein n=1 Tax=Streptomyces sp. NBC_01221 TaxID=2903782 RepID=UPI002259DE29|nr:DUF397 domain-containing protein [Streptomyces sp. NBC_01221]MCX4785842.1 DUF397 domain-containing protein [Streptomyces sp. NBC_01221]